MATLTINNIPDELLKKLEKQRTRKRPRSVEEEAMQRILSTLLPIGTSANVRLSCSVSVSTAANWRKPESG